MTCAIAYKPCEACPKETPANKPEAWPKITKTSALRGITSPSLVVLGRRCLSARGGESGLG